MQTMVRRDSDPECPVLFESLRSELFGTRSERWALHSSTDLIYIFRARESLGRD
jgi:hypothetical protein